MYKRTIGSFALATALFMVLLTSAVLTRAAATSTGQFIVQANVALDCSVKSTTNINFGTIHSPTTLFNAPVASGIITVDCPASAQYWISLSKGNGAGATFAQRKMTSSSNSADTIIYSLYTELGTVWGDGTDGSEREGSWGTIHPIPFTVVAKIPVNQAPAAGSYTDTIVVTLSF